MKSRIRYCVRNWIVEVSVLSLPFGLSVHFARLVGSTWCHIVLRRSRNQNVSLCSFGNSFEYSWYRDVNKLNGHFIFSSDVTRSTSFGVKEGVARAILTVACYVVLRCRSLWSWSLLLCAYDPFVFSDQIFFSVSLLSEALWGDFVLNGFSSCSSLALAASFMDDSSDLGDFLVPELIVPEVDDVSTVPSSLGVLILDLVRVIGPCCAVDLMMTWHWCCCWITFVVLLRFDTVWCYGLLPSSPNVVARRHTVKRVLHVVLDRRRRAVARSCPDVVRIQRHSVPRSVDLHTVHLFVVVQRCSVLQICLSDVILLTPRQAETRCSSQSIRAAKIWHASEGTSRQPSLPLNKITWTFSLIPLTASVTTLIEKTHTVLNTWLTPC